jgi:hypothetical protein
MILPMIRLPFTWPKLQILVMILALAALTEKILFI